MMKFKKMFFLILILAGVSLVSCESDTTSSPQEDFYVNFTGTGYSGSWTSGYSDAVYGSKPSCSMVTSDFFYGMGSQVPVATSSFSKDTVNHLYIMLTDNTAGTYNTLACVVQIRLDSLNGGNSFQLTGEYVTITHSDSSYVEGTFTGNDFNGNTVTGAFKFNNAGDDNWPVTD